MSKPLHHDHFTIDRVYKAPLPRVYHALTDPEMRLQWFIAPKECVTVRRELDLRVGGTEIWLGQFPNRATSYHATFFHVQENHSLVYTYDMHLDGEHHSISLASIELFEVPEGTRLVFRETVTFFDGTESAQGRQGGVGWHFENLAVLLEPERQPGEEWPCPHVSE